MLLTVVKCGSRTVAMLTGTLSSPGTIIVKLSPDPKQSL